MRKRTIVAILAALTLLGLLGCAKEEDESQSGRAATSTTTANPQAVPESSTAMSPVLPGAKTPSSRVGGVAAPAVNVELSEYAIRIDHDLAPGSITLSVVNAGKETHGLVIEGNGDTFRLPNDLSRGDTATLAVTLKPGSYTAYSAANGDRDKGMSTTFSVKQQ